MSNVLNMFDTVSASEQGSWLSLVKPGTEETAYADEMETKPLRIKVKGQDSTVWQNFVKKAVAAKDNDKKTPEQIALSDSELLARMTLAFENIPDDSGKKDREFSFESAVSLYLNYKDIRQQVLGFVMDRVNFTSKRVAD